MALPLVAGTLAGGVGSLKRPFLRISMLTRLRTSTAGADSSAMSRCLAWSVSANFDRSSWRLVSAMFGSNSTAKSCRLPPLVVRLRRSWCVGYHIF